MKYAIISDIHSNLQALKAVLLDIKASNCDQIICLGDIVGYGPQPADTLALAYSKVNHFVLGNHDAVICGKMSTENFSDYAQKAIEWTRERLDEKAVNLFSKIPYELSFGQFRCTHGSFVVPERFGYVFDANEAFASFCVTGEQLLFIGHSHVPGVFVYAPEIQRSPIWCAPADFKVEANARYLVNVGSVGYARDKDFRACYCILDTHAGTVQFRRVPFDVDRFREEVEKAGMTNNNTFLHVIDGTDNEPLIDFSPKAEPVPESFQPVEAPSAPPPPIKKEKLGIKHAVAFVATLFIILLGALLLKTVYYAEDKEIIESEPEKTITDIEAQEAPVTPHIINIVDVPTVPVAPISQDTKRTPSPPPDEVEKPKAPVVENDTNLDIKQIRGFKPRTERVKTTEEILAELVAKTPEKKPEVISTTIVPHESAEEFKMTDFFESTFVGSADPILPLKNAYSLFAASKWSIGHPQTEDSAYPFTIAFSGKNRENITLSESVDKSNYIINVEFKSPNKFMLQTHPIHIDFTAKTRVNFHYSRKFGDEMNVYILYHFPDGSIYQETRPASVKTSSYMTWNLPAIPKYNEDKNIKMSFLVLFNGKECNIRDIRITPDK